MNRMKVSGTAQNTGFLFVCLLLGLAQFTEAFSPKFPTLVRCTILASSDKDKEELSNYKDSDGASKGIVGSLTGLVNRVSAATKEQPIIDTFSNTNAAAPQSPEELLERIRMEYDEKNYLWTGDLDLDCFDPNCVFTDPTISFQGTDKFTENTQNLVPIVEAFAENYRSDLLDIKLGSGNDENESDGFYVETRWNMVGSLTANPWFFWKPKIDVIGRTKFWFREQEGVGYKVYFYDESWEIAAWKALLQIITPAGTFPSTNSAN